MTSACLRLVAALSLVGAAVAATAPDPAIAKRLETSCVECHDADTRKGNLRLDTLAPVERDPSTLATWTLVHDRVAAGEMPPKKKLAPSDAAAFAATLATALTAADGQRQRTGGRTVYRRLNRVEYENTLRCLLYTSDAADE